MSIKPYAAIILAAGLSSRMKQLKPLLTVGGETITDRLISTFKINDVEVYLVIGYRGDEIKKSIKNSDIHFVENKDFMKGMFSSIQSGVRALMAVHTAFFISPVDIPLIRPFTIKQLISASKMEPERIFYPVFGGKRGHPPLIPIALAATIQRWECDGGLKVFLNSYEENFCDVNVPDKFIIKDVDSEADYHELKESYNHYTVPTEEECREIIENICKMSPVIYRHSVKVAELAMAIGKSLLEAGYEVDLAVIKAAGLLHDIAKGRKKHAETGRQMLLDMGFSGVADVVSMHMYLPESEVQIPLEAKIVYLADKYVKNDKLVTIAERFAPSLDKFKNDPEIRYNILMRKQQAVRIEQEIETILGNPIRSIL